MSPSKLLPSRAKQFKNYQTPPYGGVWFWWYYCGGIALNNRSDIIVAMATLTILQKPSLRKIRVDVDLNQWERLADILGFYRPSFLKILKQSLKESKQGKVRKIESLRELEK